MYHLPGEKALLRLHSEQRRIARLEGESEGRTQGRVSERSLIVKWLRLRPEKEADRLSFLIEAGAHTKD
jgi:hypothetical protein